MTLPETTLRRAAAGILSDRVAVETSDALRVQGIDAVLLKGPAIASWLYAGSGARLYGDVDLLVPSDRRGPAERVLAGLGFVPQSVDGDFPIRGPQHANEWRRASDGASVDLHTSISGALAPAIIQWERLTAVTERLRLGRGELTVLAEPARLVVVVLHAAHHGEAFARPAADVARAVEVVPDVTWAAAARLARDIDAAAAFGAGLRLVPGGDGVAERLGLPRALPPGVALRSRSAPPPALGLLGLLEARGPGERLGLLLRGIVPTAAALRLGRPVARRGRLGLAAAYTTHPLWLARHLGPSILAVHRARKEAR